jgi:hemoglobin/transferrin/lactoferrin receptor protein
MNLLEANRGLIRTPALAGAFGVALLCLLGAASSALGKETNSPSATNLVVLPEVNITARRIKAPPMRLPYLVNAIEAEELNERLPRTLPEALRDTPGVMVQKTAHGQGSPFIRGFTGFRTLLLVDGIRLNNSTFREGPNQYWNTVDSLTIDRLEVVKGPSSVHYGSDAIGGTVNALTTGPTGYADGFGWERRAFYRVSSAESSHTARAEVSGHFDQDVGFFLGGSWKDYGDLRGGQEVRRQKATGYLDRDLDGKVEWHVNPDARIVVAHQTVDQDDAWRTHRTTQGAFWRGTTVGTDQVLSYDQNRHLSYVQYHAERLSGFAQEVHASVSHHLQGETEFRRLAAGTATEQGVEVTTLGLNFHLVSATPVGRWVYGAEYYHDWVGSFRRNYNAASALTGTPAQGPVADDAAYHLAGLFAEDTIPFLDERVELSLGGRFTYAAADAARVINPVGGATMGVSDSWHAFTGSARVIWHVDERDRWHVFAGASQGFRAPNLSDLTRFDIAQTGELETPQPNLKPEHFLTLESGVKVQHERFTAQASYFHTLVSDLIVRTPTGAIIGGLAEVTKLNSGSGHIHGLEFDGSVRLNPLWTLRANATWMEGWLDVFPASVGAAKRREPASRLMPATTQLALKYLAPAQRWWAEAGATVAAQQNRLSSSDVRDTQRIPPGGTPGFAVYHFRAGWQAAKGFSLTGAIENLTDEDYRVHGSGLNEAGRNFILAADWRF